MPGFLPDELLVLFSPRAPLPFLPPAAKLPHEKGKRNRGYQGVGGWFLDSFEDPKDTPPPTKIETAEERKERRRKIHAEQVTYKLEQEIALRDPHSYPNATSDPFKTLFVARMSYDSSESTLRREFEGYGSIRKVVMIHDKKDGKPRGYAFIEFDREEDMRAAYKYADGKKIYGRRILVDVERGRTVKGWLPRRLGGGLGGTRRGKPEINNTSSGREDSSSYRKERKERESRGERRVERDQKDEGHDRTRSKRMEVRSRSRERRRRRSRSKSRGERSRRTIQSKDDGGKGKRSRSRDDERGRDRSRKRSNGSSDKDRKMDPQESKRVRDDKDGGRFSSMNEVPLKIKKESHSDDDSDDIILPKYSFNLKYE